MSILEDIELALNVRGLQTGTPEYEVAFTAAKVERCQEMQAVTSCFSCPAFDHCELAKTHLRNERARAYAAGVKQGQEDETAAQIIGEVDDGSIEE